MLDEETELAEKFGVFFDSVSDLVPQKLIKQKDLFSQGMRTEQYFFKCMKGSFAWLLEKKSLVFWLLDPRSNGLIQNHGFTSDKFVMKTQTSVDLGDIFLLLSLENTLLQ